VITPAEAEAARKRVVKRVVNCILEDEEEASGLVELACCCWLGEEWISWAPTSALLYMIWP
jgi:hypothetical protein